MSTANTFEAWTERLAQRAEIFPHQLDLINDKLLLVELSAAEVSAASFLDQRVLKQTTRGTWIPWQAVADIINQAPRTTPPAFIFHVGHCGSTLLSRLLEFAEDTCCLREPLPLRTLAQDFADRGDGRSFLGQQAQLERLGVLAKMWRRGAAHSVIKATSICTDLLAPIHATEPASQSIFIFNRLETHVATLLAGQNAMVDLKGFAQLRLQRVQQKTGLDIQLSQLSTGQLAALSWLSETTSAMLSCEKHAQNIAMLDFESLLRDPAQTLTRMLRHLNIPADGQTVENAVHSPVLRTYSKDPEHKYDAKTRAAILADSHSRFGHDIKSALDWVEQLASQSDLVAATLRKFA
ncbi:MAG TPA: hypothetical protein VIS57_09040 [Xanthomonadales bacterium]